MHPDTPSNTLSPIAAEVDADELDAEVEERRLEIPPLLHRERLDRALVPVSYTHLTLPTKRIV